VIELLATGAGHHKKAQAPMKAPKSAGGISRKGVFCLA